MTLIIATHLKFLHKNPRPNPQGDNACTCLLDDITLVVQMAWLEDKNYVSKDYQLAMALQSNDTQLIIIFLLCIHSIEWFNSNIEAKILALCD